MKAFTLFLFVFLFAGAGVGEAAQGLSIEVPAETLHVHGTNSWTRWRAPLERSFEGSLSLRRATRRALVYRGHVTVVEEIVGETREIDTWMELRLRQRRGEWSGRAHIGYPGSRATATLNRAETSGIDQIVFRGPIMRALCDDVCGHSSIGTFELTVTETE